jgi:hypothetical protein
MIGKCSSVAYQRAVGPEGLITSCPSASARRFELIEGRDGLALAAIDQEAAGGWSPR